MKPMIVRALVLVCLLGLPATGLFADTIAERGLLWRIEHPDADAPSHLFGTMHVADPAVTELPDAVDEAFTEAERYLFEVDFAAVNQAAVRQTMSYDDGTTLREAIGDDLWSRVRSAADARGIPEQNIRSLKPWALVLTLGMPQQQPTETLDYQLHARASENDGPIHGLETMQEQLELFDRLDESVQIDFLRQTLNLIEDDQLEPLFDDMVERYFERDLAGLAELTADHPGLPSSAQADADDFLEKLVEERNRKMVERMESALADGGAFVAVGALHLPGNDGLIRLLEERGYAVSRVY